MRRASYRKAIEFIALNDSVTDDDAHDAAAVGGLVTSVLVSEIFGVPTAKVAADVIRVREKEGLMTKNTFRKGRSTFTCVVCGRLTRDTGAQSVGSECCPDCYELAGVYNAVQDGESAAKYADTIRACTQNILDKGGRLDGDAQTLLAAVAAK